MPTVIAYGTEKQAYFELFMESCRRFGINPVILGWGERWIGSGGKLISICKFIKDLPANEIILSVDPFDVIFLTDLEEIEAKFREKNTPFLCGALKLSAFNARVYDHEFNRTLEPTPETPTGYNFLNAGTWISTAGYAFRLLKQCIEGGKINPGDIDQEILTSLYIEDNFRVNIDWKCELFHNLLFRNFVTRQPDLSDILFQDGRIRNTATGSWPLLIHASGNTLMAGFVSALEYHPSLAIPKKDIKNYLLKACFHLGKILKYAISSNWSALFPDPLHEGPLP
jgi:hypothetical protein